MGGFTFDESVFKAYDIRGVYPKEIDKKFAYNLGRAFAQYTKAKSVMVGFDGRTSSKALFESLSKGLTERGVDVVNIGLCSTSASYYAMIQGKYDAGIMITASHNPKQYNGFKMLGAGPITIFSDNGALDILEIMKENKYGVVKKKGKIKKKDYSKEFLKYLIGFFPSLNKTEKEAVKELKVIVDQSNGAGFTEVEALKKFFPKCKVLNGRVSGAFPGHDPNPMKPENRRKMVLEIKKSKADLGVMFDGDADRLVFIDEKGCFVRPDLILCVLVDMMSKGSVIYDTRSTRRIQELCDSKNIKAAMSKSGRTYIYEAMKNERANLGGEASGHYFFKEFKYLDNAGIAAMKLLGHIVKQKAKGKTFSELIEPHNKYFHSGELNFKVRNQDKVFLLIEQAFGNAKKILFIDGLSFYYEDHWFNVRKSNTEPLVRISIEADTKELLKDMTSKINNIMHLAK